MCYAVLVTTARRTPDATLAALDDALISVRRPLLKPGHRQALFARIGAAVEAATLRAMHVVAAAEGTPSVTDVAEALSIDPSTASRIVQQGVAAGYLTKVPDPKDKRRCGLVLSDEGHAVIERARAVRTEWLQEVLRDWSEDEVLLLAQLLFRLRDDIDALEVS